MLESLTALLVYFGAFAVGGYHRGLQRELLTFCGSLLVLASLIWYRTSAQFVPSSLAELVEGLEFSRANLVAVSQSWWTMALWILACLVTYWLGSRMPQVPGPVSARLVGAVLAMGNGLVYWLLLIPWLIAHITLELEVNRDALPEAAIPISLALTAVPDQTRDWLAVTGKYLPTLLVILGIGILIHLMSRTRRSKLHKHSRIR